MPSNHIYGDFQSAATAVMNLLRERLGFDLWMVTRVEGQDFIILQTEGEGYEALKEGVVIRWADTFCSRMVQGRGPRIAPSSMDVPCYASAPGSQQLSIGAYIGVPLTRADGSLFGTLCAIDPSPQPDAITAELPTIEVLAALISTILAAELQAAAQQRRIEQAEAESLTDALTQVYNRRGWDQLMVAEESRCARYGHPACVFSIDLDGLKEVNDKFGHAKGDELIRAAAQAIRSAVRAQDVVARVGGDEFLVLGVECDADGAHILESRIASALDEARVEASVGFAMREPSCGLTRAVELADVAMYTTKRVHHEIALAIH